MKFWASQDEAIRYALARWPALCRFLDDGRIELDNNSVERAIRPVALGRKNHLFAGSDSGGHRWAVVCSLITSAKLNGVEPYAYLKDVLERMVAGHPAGSLDELLPWECFCQGDRGAVGRSRMPMACNRRRTAWP